MGNTIITPAMSVESDSPLGRTIVASLRRLADIFEHDDKVRPNSLTFDAENGTATITVSLKPLVAEPPPVELVADESWLTNITDS
jgi:hypothetical protein